MDHVLHDERRRVSGGIGGPEARADEAFFEALRMQLRFTARFPLACAALALVFSSRPGVAQIRYSSGQNVVPVYEGWERNPDGSFNMVFGYMNRNYEES